MANVSFGKTVARGVDPEVAAVFSGAPTVIDAEAVEGVRQAVIPGGTKGMPLTTDGMTVAELGATGWNVLGGQFAMPLLVLKHTALEANVRGMADYCRQHGVWLSPHGKTTMSPQLFRSQIDAGAWAMTAATPTHLRLYRQFGVGRIFYADQLVEPSVIKWVIDELDRDPDFDFYCLVDSLQSVEILGRELKRHGARRPLRVLVEVGYRGGRCGARDGSTAVVVAAAVDRVPTLELCGVECFEGLLSGDDDFRQIDEFLASARSVAVELLEQTSLQWRREILLSAGGSVFFDRVIRAFVDGWEHPTMARVVLRSGCYITQDGGFYARNSPLQDRGAERAVLREGIEAWAAVLSRPEADLVIASMGRRDVPEDMGAPAPRWACTPGHRPRSLNGAEVLALSDQHAHIRIDAADELAPGDLIGASVSHPCTAFDRWRLIPVVDDDYAVCDAVVTFF